MRTLLLGMLAILFFSFSNPEKYIIKGNVPNQETKKVYLKELVGGVGIVIDSAIVVNGEYVIEGSVNKPTPCFLFEEFNSKPFSGQFFVENVKFSANYDSATRITSIVTDCGAQKLYLKFNNLQAELNTKKYALDDRYADLKANEASLKEGEFEAKVKKLRKDWDIHFESYKKKQIELINANLSSVVAADAFLYFYKKISPKEAKEIASRFTGNAGSSELIASIIKKIDWIEACKNGKPAPDFTLNTPEGKPLTLSSFKGKIVILDFWASWCGPCRAENPNIIKLHNKFHNKGLEIISISLDRSKEAWVKAIKKDGMVWHHVSELKKWKSEIVSQYGVSAVPHIVIVNEEGIIVAKNLRGEALERKIAEMIN